MAAVAGPLDRRCSSAVSVDIDPGWYEGQLETADAADATALTPETGAAAAAPPPQGAASEQSPGEAKPPGSHVPTVLTKLQKWGDYESFGEPVWPTKFIPMKTPLSHEILDNWQLPEAPKHRLTVSTLLEAEKAAGRRVGLLLDLSNHDCLYDVDIPPDVQYLHVQLVAKELPPLEFVQEVARAASGFWAQHPDQYIAVHCAYGFNRTGFVVCSYLIECCGLTVDQALQSFAASRPPGVKHERFRQELWARYGNSNSSNSSIPPPAPQPTLLPDNTSSSSASSSSTGFYLAARAAAAAAPTAAAGVCEGSSCRPCDSTASSTGTAWPGNTNALAGAAGVGVEQQGLACSSDTFSAASTAAAAAAVAPARVLSSAADGAPAVAACELGDTQQPAAAAASGGAGRPRDSLPGYSSSSNSTDDVSCSMGGCLPRVSSAGTAPHTPSAPPLPPQVLTPSSSRALLTGSPALRLGNRCWSSNSVGDNSSIGCSPSSSAADLVTLRTSGLSSAHSSGLDSSAGGAPDTPYSTAAAGAGAAGHLDGGVSLSQQWGQGGGGDACLGLTHSSSHHQQQQQLRGSGGVDVLLAGDGEEEEQEQDVGEILDEGCFEMDPCTDVLPPQQQQQQQLCHCRQQQQQLYSRESVARRKSVTFDDTTLCCEQPAPGCKVVQQLPTAELNMLLASVSIEQQHQQLLPSLTQLQPPLQQQQQQQQAVAAEDCSCSCHSLQQLSVSPDAAVGGSIRGSSSSSNHPLQSQPFREPGSGGRMGRGYHSSEDGVMDPLENESFGKLTSADLLKNLRSLQQKYDRN